MSFFTSFSNSSAEISFRSIFWIPSILLGITILLGFRFYDKSPVASATLLSGDSKSFLQAAAEPEKITVNPAQAGNIASSSGTSTPSPVAQSSESQNARQTKETSLEQNSVLSESGGVLVSANSLTSGAGSIIKAEEKQASPSETAFKETELDILNLTTEEVKILQSLSARRNEIEKREKSVLDREHLLEIAEKRIDQKVQELEKIRDILKEMVSAKEEHEKERMRGLVKIYELMKPDKAALIFEGLDLEVLLEVVDMMKEVKLSPILSAMNPRAAQKLTVELAARRKFTQEISQMNQKETEKPDDASQPNGAKAEE
ncbi:MAG: MotE family protein [Alphaproteobacteria bacterium]